MPDSIFLIVFGSIIVLSLAFSALCLYLAVRNAKKADGEIAMVMWALASLAGFVVGGLSFAYFILPILLNRL